MAVQVQGGLLDDEPEIIAHADAARRFERYVKLRGSVSRYMSQPLGSFPAGDDDWVPPTRTFRDEMSITVGGERFDLVHRKGETDEAPESFYFVNRQAVDPNVR